MSVLTSTYFIGHESLMHDQPGFMRTEMTKGVGFDKFWDDGGGRNF